MLFVVIVRQMNPSSAASKKPLNVAITNGFMIGSFPHQIQYSSSDKDGESKSIDVMKDVNEVMKVLVAPLRPFGYIFQHFGGFQKSIQGHFQFFQTDQHRVTGMMNYHNEQNVNDIFGNTCGTMTLKQKSAILKKTSVDIELFKDICTLFTKNCMVHVKNSPIQDDVEALMLMIIEDH